MFSRFNTKLLQIKMRILSRTNVLNLKQLKYKLKRERYEKYIKISKISKPISL